MLNDINFVGGYERYGASIFMQCACDAWDNLIRGGAQEEDLFVIQESLRRQFHSDFRFQSLIIKMSYLWKYKRAKIRGLFKSPPQPANR
jgi:hypothetical protein